MEKDIGKIKKNETTDIIVRIDDYGGRTGLTIREYTTSERYTGFTKSGTRIAADSFKEFKRIINSIDEKELEASVEKLEKKEKTPKKTVKKEKKKEELKEDGESDEEEISEEDSATDRE